MPSNIPLKIVIAEPSAIIRYGLETMLKRLPGFRLSLTGITHIDTFVETIRNDRPDILIINPSIPGHSGLGDIKERTGLPEMKCIALLYTVADSELLRPYDEQISIYDTPEILKNKLECLKAVEREGETGEDEQQTLSAREKEIVVCVVKGMTNREIADRLFLSAHTVITHRRNIARKLQIHSVGGLTVYAIVNKLVELSDIKMG